MLLTSPCAMMERICICLLRDECQDGRDDQHCVHISSSFLSSTCLQDISIFLRLHSTVHARYIFPLRLDSTVPAGNFFPLPPSFYSARKTFLSSSAFIYSARWTFLSFSAFILQCPLDISFLFRLHSTVPAGHFFPLPSLQCPQDLSFPTRLILLYSARKKTKAFNSDTSKVIYVLFITFHVPVIL